MWRSRYARVALFVCLGLAAAWPASAQDGANYLPLAVGNRWELKARNNGSPMVLEVVDRDGDGYIVRWDNPFVPITFRFVNDGARVRLTGLQVGSGTLGPVPSDSVYFDFGKRKGERWKSAVGSGEIADRGARVQTPAGDYADTIEVRAIDNQGQSMYWTFAANVGLVRWGRGRDAYLLSNVSHGTPAAAPLDTRRSSSPAPRAVPRAASSGGRVLVGLDATPNERSGGGKRGKLAALRQAYDAGMTLLHIAPKWNEFERSRGRYDFNDDADAVGEFADEMNLPIALNIRIVDTNQRSMPKDYSRWNFDDEQMADRLKAAIRAFPASYKKHTRYLAIGNEVDVYFGSHRNEIAAYATLIGRVRDTVRQEFPNAEFTVNFTFGGVNDMGRYRAITDQTDFASFTYYPLNADFTMRPVADLPRDVDRMLDAAGGKRLYIQEIGYASAERLKSSPQQQAQFYTAAFDQLRAHADRIVGATFLFMSDFSQAIVDFLGGYYGTNGANFKAYVGTLGILERNGNPKPAWDVFRREAQAMKAGR